MIRSGRRRHFQLMALAIPAGIALVVAAYLVRPPALPSELPPRLAPPVAGFAAFTDRADLFGPLTGVHVRISEQGELRLRSDALLGPSVMLYFRDANTVAAGLEGARLLGSVPTEGEGSYRLPQPWRGGGRLLLFSLGHMELVGQSLPLPTPPQGEEPTE